MQKKNFTMGNMTVLHLKKYNLLQYLTSKDYNSCAWAVVRAEMIRNFSFLKCLTGHLCD